MDTTHSIKKKIPFLEAGNTEFQTITFRLHVGLSVCNLICFYLICFFFGNIGYRAVFCEPNRADFLLGYVHLQVFSLSKKRSKPAKTKPCEQHGRQRSQKLSCPIKGWKRSEE